MQTIRLRVHDNIYKSLMNLLSKFNTKEVQVIEENDTFVSVQQYLAEELSSIESGKAEFIDVEQLDNHLEATIQKYED